VDDSSIDPEHGPVRRLSERFLALLSEPEFQALSHAEILGALELLKFKIVTQAKEQSL
jgi:hypothetical protein